MVMSTTRKSDAANDCRDQTDTFHASSRLAFRQIRSAILVKSQRPLADVRHTSTSDYNLTNAESFLREGADSYEHEGRGK